MKIYVVGSSKNKFLPISYPREYFYVDKEHIGQNIDFLNPWYCELTGLYYLLCHTNDDIIGLEHYRTYFWDDGKPISESRINQKLATTDIICGAFKYPAFGSATLNIELNKCTRNVVPQYLDIVRQIDTSFAKYLELYLNGTHLWCCNMFIGKRTIIQEWVALFLRIITKFEQLYPVGYNTNTSRREGYFAEFTFGAWLEYNGYNIEHCDIMKLKKNLTAPEFIIRGPSEPLIYI